MSRLSLLVAALAACSAPAGPQKPAPAAAALAPAAPPTPPAPPGDAALATVEPDAAPAAPQTLATDLAIVYADKLGLVRAGSPVTTEPQLVALPSQVFKAPVWSAAGEIFVGLAHGAVARVDATGLHVLTLPKAMQLPWQHRFDALYRAVDGSVWAVHCVKPGKHPDECRETRQLRVDVAGAKPTARGPGWAKPTPWPKVAPPAGFTMRFDGEGDTAHVVCEGGPEGSAYKMPAGDARLPGLNGGTLWVSRSPAVLAVHVVQLGWIVVPDPPGSHGGTTNTETYVEAEHDVLLADCDYKRGQPTHVVAAPDGLYAYRDGDQFVIARDGQLLHTLPGAKDVAFGP
jgi:hypothetical protein